MNKGSKMKIISLFNNKGGVGKTTLSFHLSHILAELGYKVLMIDLDAQCNLTICSINQENLAKIWEEEEQLIADFKFDWSQHSSLLDSPRTIHFLLKPTEDGRDPLSKLPPPIKIKKNLDLIPGRLTIHKYESKIAERFNGVLSKDPLAIRTVTDIRGLAHRYTLENNYDFVILDTSPSLGALNQNIISMADAFLIPALPDMFSSYGVKNIGNALNEWSETFSTIQKVLPENKRTEFPRQFVRFLGYTIYNAKKYTKSSPDKWNLAQAHYNYAKNIPDVITKYIPERVWSNLTQDLLKSPIGNQAVMLTHNTLPNMAQKYNTPIWDIPDLQILDIEDRSTIRGNHQTYRDTKEQYKLFAMDFLTRIGTLDKSILNSEIHKEESGEAVV